MTVVEKEAKDAAIVYLTAQAAWLQCYPITEMNSPAVFVHDLLNAIHLLEKME